MKAFNPEEVKHQLKEIIVNDLDMSIDMQDIDDNASLYDDGLGLDSIAIINFIVLIEKKFGISFNENEISARLFSSINNLADFVGSRASVSSQPLKSL
ncbi:phosphopantetheine-binding protein [Flavitalea sp. BT771]|uniref:acyl carrier protein n=1 Tax=Flavitalea sp. BT771 TaxID=3063329 RepID=UPI0026E35697|nr:phosphopantetheine-binding protein [Flavitalea sp. BT771]MDO6431636.1 phosphopantetheine-binding protein [Flavitalea sp. BT771]MDV6220544.1 phosphopantetheine-binding protein [Flavitalea sp. BT771]